MAAMQGTIKRMGLRPRMHWKPFNQAACVRRTQCILEGHGTLESFRLVLPDSYKLWAAGDRELYDNVLNPATFGGNLHVTLLRLHGGMVDDDRDLQALTVCRRWCIASHVRARDTALELVWEVRVEAYGGLGYYPLELAEGDVVGEIPGSGT